MSENLDQLDCDSYTELDLRSSQIVDIIEEEMIEIEKEVLPEITVEVKEVLPEIEKEVLPEITVEVKEELPEIEKEEVKEELVGILRKDNTIGMLLKEGSEYRFELRKFKSVKFENMLYYTSLKYLEPRLVSNIQTECIGDKMFFHHLVRTKEPATILKTVGDFYIFTTTYGELVHFQHVNDPAIDMDSNENVTDCCRDIFNINPPKKTPDEILYPDTTELENEMSKSLEELTKKIEENKLE